MLKKFNLYYSNGNDSFKLKDLKEFERTAELELKQELNEIKTIEQLEEEIEKINEKFKNKKISFFLINKEDDEEI